MTTRRRRRPPASPPKPPPLPTVDQAYALADDLLRALTPLAGQPAAVDRLMRRWLDRHDVAAFGMVALCAVRTVFVDYLTPTPSADVPPGALGFTTTKETTHA